jgi:hypothetical protein
MADFIYCPGQSVSWETVTSGLIFAELPDLAELAAELKEIPSGQLRRLTLVAHNGDHVPGVDCYAELVRVLGSVYSVNVDSSLEALGVKPLPIGLENRYYNRVGRLTYFPSPAEFEGTLAGPERPISVLASFRISTNPAVRESLKAAAISAGVHWLEPSKDNQRYFEAVRRSTFVLSPPGNGPDCHRTWEALYSGAVPVVLASALSAKLTDGLPILRVESYEEFLKLSWIEKSRLIDPFRNMRPSRAYMPYWCNHLSANP